MNSKDRRDFRRYLFRYQVLSMLALVAGLALVYSFTSSLIRRSTAETATNLLEITGRRLVEQISDYVTDALLLSQLSSVQDIALHPTNPNKLQTVKEDYLTFARDRYTYYDQVRLLDKSGMELIRVNTNQDGSIQIVPENELQDKSDRLYYRQGQNLDFEEVSVSRMDLNIEKGKIEIPYKSVIRFTTPIRDSNGGHFGYVVLNILGDRLAEMLRMRETRQQFKLYYVNPEGYFVEAPDPSMAWGWQLNDRSRHTLENWNPELHKELAQNDKGTVFLDGDLFAYSAYSPLGTAKIKEGQIVRTQTPVETTAKGYFIIQVPRKAMVQITWSHFESALLFALLSLIPIAFTNWQMASRRIHAKERQRLRKESDILRATQSLAWGVAHEFRQPLAALDLAVKLIEVKDVPLEQRAKYLDRIPPNVKRIDGLVSRLLTLTEVKEIHYTDQLKILDIQASAGETVE